MRLIDAKDAQKALCQYCICGDYEECSESRCVEFRNIAKIPPVEARPVVRVAARPLEEWHEDYGDVLWWKFPIEEPPYVGSPLDCNWSGYHTHWTPIEVPEPPNGGAYMRGTEDG